jgi:hypothetical protein
MRRAALAVVFSALVPGAASAAVIIDFGTGFGGPGGIIYDLGGGHARGEGIYIDAMGVQGTSSDDVYNVDGSGACATGVGASCGTFSFDTQAGTFSIVGSVPDLPLAEVTLVSGTISSFSFTAEAFGAFLQLEGPDTKYPGLLDALGVAPGTAFSLFGVSLAAGPLTDCGDGNPQPCYTAFSTDLANHGDGGSTAIPEPATLMLMGAGLLGVARARGRRA